MATINFKDRTRPDQRSTVEPSPVWISSGRFTYEDAGLGACLFLFEKSLGSKMAIHGAVLQIEKAFAGGTPSIDIGLGTVLYGERAIEYNSVITIVDADGIIPSADITEGTAGSYPALTGASVTLWAAGQMQIVTCDDTTIPCVYATLSSGLTAGAAQLHLLMSLIPV